MVHTRSNPDPVEEEAADSMDTTEAQPAGKAPSTEELRRLVGLADGQSPVGAGEHWFIISAKWYAQMKNHLAEGAGNETTNPGSIDNADLIVKFEEQNELRENAVEKVDFEFIPEKLWAALIATFGGGVDVDEQAIAVTTYETQEYETKIEARPLSLTCCLYPKLSETTPVHVSRSATIDSCLEILLAKFDLSLKDNRFWIFSPDGFLTQPDSDNTKNPIATLYLTIKHLIVVERKDVHGRWPLDDTKTHDKAVADLKKLQNEAMDVTGTEKKGNVYNLRSSNGSRENSVSSNYGAGSKHTGSPRGLVGLGNLGNTCFMNSSLQCLSNVPELTEFFRSNAYKDDINMTNPLGKKGDVAKVYADLIDDLWSPTSNAGSVYPSKFKSTLCRYTSLFNGAQQDAQESLQYVVDCLHEDLNRVKKKPYKETPDDVSGRNDQQLSDEAWANHKARNDSVVVDLFHGQLRSSVKCPDCDKVSMTFDPVCYYSLPLPTNQMKKVSYVYVPYDPQHSPARHKLTIQKNVDVEEFLKRVAEQVSVESNHLIALTLYDFRATLLKKDRLCEDITDRDRIFVYQTSKSLDDPNYLSVIVYTRKLKDASKAYMANSGTPCDFPVVLTLPSSGISARLLYHLVYTKLNRRLVAPADSDLAEENSVAGDKGGSLKIKSESGESSRSNTGENRPPGEKTGQQPRLTDADEKMEDDEFDPPADSNLFVPPIFTISTINSFGNTENKSIKNAPNVHVTFPADRDSHYISVNFTESCFSKYYKKETNMPPEEDKYQVSNVRGAADTVDLRDCFQLYINPERLTDANMWRCPVCKEEKLAVKKLDLWKMPKYMIVHLKRFQYNRFYRDKLSTKVRFPVTGLDLSDLVLNPKLGEPPAVYDLVAVSCHSGGLGGGHYWAVCKNKDDGQWYKFDDSRVGPASSNDIENETNPYILVFKRTEDAGTDRETKMEE